jgi:Homeodomain-like domain
VLVQPATVARWRRQGFRGCWSRHSRRRPARPRIDSQLRALIRRLATENRLWGAPRIHGELLKLGVTVSERTVSRYLPDRRTAPSQTWRTFLANHLGDLAFTSTKTLSSAPGDDDVVDEDARVFPLCPAPPSRAQPCVSNPCAVVDWPSSLERTFLGCRVAQDHLHRRARTRASSGKDPPKRWAAAISARAYGPRFRSSRDSGGSKPTNSLRPFAGSWIASAVLGVSRGNRSSTSSEGTDADFVPAAKRTSASDFHSARNIGEAQQGFRAERLGRIWPPVKERQQAARVVRDVSLLNGIVRQSAARHH